MMWLSDYQAVKSLTIFFSDFSIAMSVTNIERTGELPWRIDVGKKPRLSTSGHAVQHSLQLTAVDAVQAFPDCLAANSTVVQLSALVKSIGRASLDVSNA